jgi:hypothetical protein
MGNLLTELDFRAYFLTMMPIRKTLVKMVALLILIVANPCQSQVNHGRFNLEMNFNSSFPRGAFGKNINKAGLGAELEGSHMFGSIPFSVGLSMTGITYGSRTRHVPFNSDTPDILVDVTTDNSIYAGHLFWRAQNREGIVRPYLEGLIGLNYIFTQTDVGSHENPDLTLARQRNIKDYVISAGMGAGITVKLGDGYIPTEY